MFGTRKRVHMLEQTVSELKLQTFVLAGRSRLSEHLAMCLIATLPEDLRQATYASLKKHVAEFGKMNDPTFKFTSEDERQRARDVASMIMQAFIESTEMRTKFVDG